MDTSLTAALGLGLVLGIRHALEPDHVAAVSTLVSRERNVVRSCLLGAFWGAGHSLALLVAAIGVITFKLSISHELEQGLERLVALVLVLLGGQVLLRSAGAWALHRHAHDEEIHRYAHVHVGDAGPGHTHLWRLGSRPFLVGLLHGLAGSAALMLLALATIESPVAGLVYVFVFGVGSTAGMLLLSGLVGIPVAVAAGRSHRLQAAIQGLAGATSLGLGVALLAGFAAT